MLHSCRHPCPRTLSLALSSALILCCGDKDTYYDSALFRCSSIRTQPGGGVEERNVQPRSWQQTFRRSLMVAFVAECKTAFWTETPHGAPRSTTAFGLSQAPGSPRTRRGDSKSSFRRKGECPHLAAQFFVVLVLHKQSKQLLRRGVKVQRSRDGLVPVELQNRHTRPLFESIHCDRIKEDSESTR